MKGFFKSFKRFKKIDGSKFGPCMDQFQVRHRQEVLEYRIELKTNKLCIIMYYPNDAGYIIFKNES